MNAKTIGAAILGGGIEGLVLEAFHMFKEPLRKGGEDLLKAHTGGRGVHDEALFHSACAHAVADLGVTPLKINKIVGVINGFTNDERERAIEVVGQSEQDAKIKIPLTENGVAVTDKDGKIVYKEINTPANIRGALTIAMLAEMKPKDIENFFKASNSLYTSDKRRKETLKKLVKAYEAVVTNPTVKKVLDGISDSTSSLKDDLEDRMADRNVFNRFADQIRANRAIRDAERVARAQEKAEKQANKFELRKAKRDAEHQRKLNKIKK